MAEKVARQAATLADLSDHVPVDEATVATMQDAATRIHVATNRDELRFAEAIAAGAYWQAWSVVELRWAKRDADRVPAHWRTFGTRSSPVTGNPRLAANPANALLNYLYALLEGEATLAARVVGRDPGLGVLHADHSTATRSRPTSWSRSGPSSTGTCWTS